MKERRDFELASWRREYEEGSWETARGILQAVLNFGLTKDSFKMQVTQFLMEIGDEVDISEPFDSLREEARQVLIRFLVPNEDNPYSIGHVFMIALVKFWQKSLRHSWYPQNKRYQKKVKAIFGELLRQHRNSKPGRKEWSSLPAQTRLDEVQLMESLVVSRQYELLTLYRRWCHNAIPFLYKSLLSQARTLSTHREYDFYIPEWSDLGDSETREDLTLFDENEIRDILLPIDAERKELNPAYRKIVMLCDFVNFDFGQTSTVISEMTACMHALLGSIVFKGGR
ncbi:hypothetical protein HQ571_02515 [Candidatus Kuenenbacteria bacterium]|nr:hypothetical protein [Candidatus Kuenenbacteria bacterium]